MNKPKRPTAPPDHRMYPRRPAAPVRPRRAGAVPRAAWRSARAAAVDTSGPTGPLVPAHLIQTVAMEYRQLGSSGLRVSALTLGTMTFGGRDNFATVGSTDVAGATRQIDLCLDRGVNFIDTADVYSGGLSEEIVGEALKGRRDRVLLATKARMPMGDGPNDAGLSRHHLIAACEASLRRLGTDYVDLYQVHEWDGQTPLEETMEALDTLVRDGKVRYVGGVELRRLAADEGARRGRPARLPALRDAADLLLAPVPRRGVRAGADRDRRGRRDHRLEPAGGRPAVGQVPARRSRPGRRRASSPIGTSRRCATRSSSTTSSRCSSRSARGTASRRRRSRSPGCSSAPAWCR